MVNLLTALKLENTKIDIRPEWRAGGPDYRQTLRSAAQKSIEEHARGVQSWVVPNNLLQIFTDLNQPPQAPGLTCSISHCPLAGGFVFALNAKYQLGLDLENAKNVKSEIVMRISNPHEVETAPSPAIMWTAKEATFKSLLGPHQPAVLSAVRLVNWQQLAPGIWLFTSDIQGLSSAQLQGVVQQEKDLIVGLSRFSS